MPSKIKIPSKNVSIHTYTHTRNTNSQRSTSTAGTQSPVQFIQVAPKPATNQQVLIESSYPFPCSLFDHTGHAHALIHPTPTKTWHCQPNVQYALILDLHTRKAMELMSCAAPTVQVNVCISPFRAGQACKSRLCWYLDHLLGYNAVSHPFVTNIDQITSKTKPHIAGPLFTCPFTIKFPCHTPTCPSYKLY